MNNVPNQLDEQLKRSIAAKEEQLVAFTQQIIRTVTVNPPGNEEKVAKILIEKLEKIGFELNVVVIEEGRPNIIATYKGSKPGPRLLCYSHMDTVPEWDREMWTTDPFGAEIIDGKIYGRGTCDHKSEIVSFITAFEALKEANVELSGELQFIFDSDEEQGGTKGMRELMSRGLVKADIGIYACTTQISEDSKENFPTLGEVNIVHAATGIVTYKLVVPGTKPHPRYLMNMETAFTPGDHAMYLLSEINKLADKVNQYYDEKTGHSKLWINSINTISKVESARPGTLGVTEIVVSRRLGPSENIDQVEQVLLEVIQKIEKKHNFTIEKELIRKRPPTFLPEDSKIIEEMKKVAFAIDGSKPMVTGVPALTGMGWFVNEGGIPMVMFGYGNLDFHHCVDEHIAISDIVKNTQAYAIAIKNILS